MIQLPYYEDSYFCLHNFAAYEMSFRDEVYHTAEHAYHAQKFEDRAIREEIRNAKSPLEAGQLAKKYREKRRLDWDEVKIQVLYEVIKEKVMQFPDVKEVLMATGNEEIIEVSPHKFWGNGGDGSGRNECGKIFMRVREELL